MTETKKLRDHETRGTLFYDGTCRFCVAGVTRFRGLLGRFGIDVQPFENGPAEPEMKLHWEDGRIFGGADAAFFMARRIPFFAPLGWLEWVPGCHWIASKLYRTIANRRSCHASDGTCRI